MLKEIKDFTIEELVNKRLRGFQKQDPDTSPSTPELCDALKVALDFKISQKQDEINNKLLKLTRWLVGLTVAIVVLTIGLVLLTYKLIQ